MNRYPSGDRTAYTPAENPYLFSGLVNYIHMSDWPLTDANRLVSRSHRHLIRNMSVQQTRAPF